MTLVAGFQLGGKQVLLADTLCADQVGTRFSARGMKSIFTEHGGIVAAGEVPAVQRVLSFAHGRLGAGTSKPMKIRFPTDVFRLAALVLVECDLDESSACETIWRLPSSDGGGVIFLLDQSGAVVFDDVLLVAGNVGPYLAGAVRYGIRTGDPELSDPERYLQMCADVACSCAIGADAPFETAVWDV